MTGLERKTVIDICLLEVVLSRLIKSNGYIRNNQSSIRSDLPGHCLHLYLSL